jgi:hypothetical protein
MAGCGVVVECRIQGSFLRLAPFSACADPYTRLPVLLSFLCAFVVISSRKQRDFHTLSLSLPIQTPHNNIPLSPPVIMKVTVKPSPTLSIPRVSKHLSQRPLKLSKKDQVLRPRASILCLELWILHHPMPTRPRPARLDSIKGLHITA